MAPMLAAGTTWAGLDPSCGSYPCLFTPMPGFASRMDSNGAPPPLCEYKKALASYLELLVPIVLPHPSIRPSNGWLGRAGACQATPGAGTTPAGTVINPGSATSPSSCSLAQSSTLSKSQLYLSIGSLGGYPIP